MGCRLFNEPHFSPFLVQDAAGCSGDLRRSNGYQSKILQNPVMNKDRRNMGVVGTSDGVPIFGKEKSARNVTPFMLRPAIDDSQANRLQNCHLHLLQPGEHITMDTATGKPVRVIKKPPSARGPLLLIADDLDKHYNEGVRIMDIPVSVSPIGVVCFIGTCPPLKNLLVLTRINTC